MAAPGQSMDSPGERAAAKKPRPRSPKVWECFRQRAKNVVLCKLCKLEMAYKQQYDCYAQTLKAKGLSAHGKIDFFKCFLIAPVLKGISAPLLLW